VLNNRLANDVRRNGTHSGVHTLGYVPCYCSLAKDVRSHKAGGGDGASEAVVCDWLVGQSNNPMDAHVA